jgi:hypothetical protein
MTWHYEKNGIRHDNVTEDDITGLIMRGELTATTLVWRQGMTEWQPVSATPLASALLHHHHAAGEPHSGWSGMDAGICSLHWLCARAVDGRAERDVF